MVRESARLVVAALAASTAPGCSLILDFSDSAAPKDAAIDAPYTQEQCDYKEPNNSLAEAAVVVAGDMGPAAICKDPSGTTEDQDFYKFTVTGMSFTVGIDLMNRPGGDLDIKLYDASGSGIPISQSREFGNTEKITCPGSSPSCPANTPGEYTLEVFAAVPGAVNNYTFTITGI